MAVVELSDVMFAFDSVPAIIAVSREPLIVYSAMLMFAILGLRNSVLCPEALKQYLVHPKKAVIALLFFIAVKLGLNATDSLWGHGITYFGHQQPVRGARGPGTGYYRQLCFPGKTESADK